MAVKFCLLRSCFVLDASFAKFSQFFIKFDYPSRNKSSIMPPKRKAVAAKEKPVEEAPIESKKTKIVKKVEDAGTNGDAKSKRGRAARGGSSDSEPKPTRGTKKPVEDEDPLEEAEEEEREETPPPVETKKRGRKASAPKPTPVESDEEEKPEKEDTPPPTRKGGRTRKPIAPPEDEDLSDEEEIEKPKPKGRAKKPAASSKAETLANPTETDYEQIDFSCDKENKLGEKPNTIIASWNVDGLRAWLKKDGLKYIEFEKPDILCIQESKCSSEKLPEEVTELEGYHKYWTESDKEGYAGVGLFSRTKPINVEYGIGVPEHDEEGRCITAEFEKYYVVSVYVPNSGRKLVTLPKRLEWNKAFKTYIKELDKKKPVIIGGDMNVAHDEIDLANPKTNTKNAGFTKEEREGMTALLGDGYIDSYRKFNPDKTGAYTFWTYMMKSRSKNVGWRLDYFLVSERLGDALCDNVIRSEVLGSDHCPIVLFLNV